MLVWHTIKDRDAWQSILGVIKWSCVVKIVEPRSQAFLDKSLIVKRFDGSTVNKPIKDKHRFLFTIP
jgi:hypothetical protein